MFVREGSYTAGPPDIKYRKIEVGRYSTYREERAPDSSVGLGWGS